MLRWFDRHGVQLEASDMSLSVSLQGGEVEWSSNGLLAQNLRDPRFLLMMRDVLSFKTDVLSFLAAEEKKTEKEQQAEGAFDLSMAEFLSQRGYSQHFIDYYILPVVSTRPTLLASYSALHQLAHGDRLYVLCSARQCGRARARRLSPSPPCSSSPSSATTICCS
jgi:predicted NAD/FAD-binding protein